MQLLRFFKQLELIFEGGTRSLLRVDKILAAPPPNLTSPSERPIHLRGRDDALESQARELLRALGAEELARKIRVEWNPRMRTCAGRADYRAKLISLNPLLENHGDEIERTLRHELAHLLAQWRVGRCRIAPHGKEWRQACRDLGIADEARCHTLPFASKSLPPRYVYRCSNCKEEFPRVRRIRHALACLACCRKHNGGDFDPRFRLKLTTKL